MKDKAFRIVGAVVLLVFVGFLIFQMSGSLDEKITTMDAVAVTVEELISADGTFIRNQHAVAGKGGNAECLVSNGEKVSVGQELCIFFDNSAASADYQHLQSLENEIEALKYLDSLVNNGADGVKLDNSVYAQINQLLSDLGTGRLNNTDKDFEALRQMVIARDAGLYSKNAFKDKLSELEKQADTYRRRLNSESSVVKSAYSGYFYAVADGYENIFSPDCIDKLSEDFILQSKKNAEPVSANTVGVVVDGFCWYIAVPVSADEAARVSNMEEVSVYIPNVRAEALSLKVEKVIKDGDRFVLLLKSSVMTADLLGTRFQPIDIVISTYTGIRVPVNALHMKDGQWGVYCLEGSSAKFKAVDIIYQTESYYLLEIAPSADKGLYLYDKILLGGKELS